MKISDILTADQGRVLREIKEQDYSERQSGSTDPLRLKAVSTPVAEFLFQTTLSRQAKVVAEFGTSAGYSTIHLAAAVAQNKGRVYTLDREAQKTTWARENLIACELAYTVELFTGECADFVESLPDSLDFVLFDIGVPHFAPYWPKIRRKMAPASMIFVDGWESLERWETEPEWNAFKTTMEADPEFLTTMLPLEKGHLVATRRPRV